MSYNLRKNMPKRNARKTEIASAFVGFLQSLDDGEHCLMIKKLAARCHVPKSVVYSWKYLSVRIPEEYYETIDSCFGQRLLSQFKKSADET